MIYRVVDSTSNRFYDDVKSKFDEFMLAVRTSKTEVVLPQFITHITPFMFRGLRSVQKMTIPSTVSMVEVGAFSVCRKLTDLTIDSTAISIIPESFCEGCEQLSSVNIPDSITTIGKNAFKNCWNLRSITIPRSVKHIDDCAFMFCYNLTSIRFEDLNSISFGSSVFVEDSKFNQLELPSGYHLDNKSFIETCIDSDIYGNFTDSNLEVTCDCNENEFYHSVISTARISKTCKQIEDHAFYYSRNLTDVILNNTDVSSIGLGAFQGCERLSSIDLNDNILKIEAHAFDKCKSLSGVVLPNRLTRIEPFSFYNCNSLTSISIPSEVSSIGAHAFDRCNHLSIVNGLERVTRVDDTAFSNTPFCDYTAPLDSPNKRVDSNGRVIFTDSALKALLEREGYQSEHIVEFKLTSFSQNDMSSFIDARFENLWDAQTSLTSAILPIGLSSIGYKVFSRCEGLQAVDIPSSVRIINPGAFEGCVSLTSIDIPNSITRIPALMCQDCCRLSSIDIPNGIEEIAEYAFFGCTDLTAISIPDSVKFIGIHAFSGCNLQRINASAETLDRLHYAFKKYFYQKS